MKNSSSITAEFGAMMRAAAYHSKVLRNVVDDRYSKLFLGVRTLPGYLFNRILIVIDPTLTKVKIPMVQVGVLCALCRHRYIENQLLQAIDNDCKQVILLGAGYDTKCLRMKNEGVRIYEVDHPLTQQRKREILKKGKHYSDTTCFISCNLAEEDLLEKLRNTGFQSDDPCVVIAEGVISYLTKERIQHTLEIIGSASKKVTLIFDYRHPVGSDTKEKRKKVWYNHFKRIGERYLGLLSKDQMERYMKDYGFTIKMRNDLSEIARQLLPSFPVSDLNKSAEIVIATRDN